MRNKLLLMGLLAVVGVLSTSLAAQNPALYYKFNSGSGTTAINDGTAGNATSTFSAAPTWNTPGQLGAASRSGQADILTGYAANTSTDWTIEFWMQGTPGTFSYLAGANGGAGGWRMFAAGVAGAANIVLRGAGFADLIITGANDGAAHHVAYVYDSTANTVTGYLDGVQNSQNTGQTGTGVGTEFRVGSQSGGSMFAGMMDDFRFWEAARTATEILANFNTEITLTPTAPTIVTTAPTAAYVGIAYSYTVVATGVGAPTFTISPDPATVGSGWLTWDNVDTLSGTPAAGDVGTIGPFTITATNGTAPDDTEVFSIVVSTPEPEMDVARGATAIADGGTDAIAGSGFTLVPVGFTYTIDNTGVIDLNLTGGGALVVSSNAANCAAVIVDPTTNPIAAAASDTFSVTVTPAAAGPWSVDISIDNDDSNENPYNFTISGTAVGGLSTPFSENFDSWAAQNGNPNPLTGGWENDAADAGVVDWWTHIGGTTSSGTGPTIDHSTGTNTGVYMYVEDSSNLQAGSPPDVNLLTPPIDLAGTTSPVLSFWVHANDSNGVGGTNNMLHVDVIDLTATTTTPDVITAITHVADATLQVWTEYVVDLSAFAGNTIRVRFRLHQTGTSFSHDVCIDSVSIVESPEMDVTRGASIADGGTDTVDILTAGSTFTYTIDNLGGNDLDLTGAPLVVVTAGTNITQANLNVTTAPTTPVVGAGSTTFVITVTPDAAGPYDFTISIDNNDSDENPYNFTVSGNAVSNVPPVVTVTGSNWVDAGGGLFTLTLNPGDTIADALTATDPTPDDMSLTVTAPATALTTLSAQPVTAASATGPLTLQWTGTADGSNAPGNYDWSIDINDGTSTVTITARIIITDVAPTHVIDAASGGNGGAATPYTASYVEGDTGATIVNLATVSDANTSQVPSISGTPTQTSGPTTGTGFQWSLTTGTLSVMPAGTLVANDGGVQVFDVTVTDGSNPVVITVAITVSTVSGNITFTNTSPLAGGTVNAVYATVTMVATGGTAAYTYAVVSGALPVGLSLSASGDITGTPTTAGTVSFDIRATDSTNDSGTATFEITINAAGGGSPSPGGGGDDDGGCASSTTGSSLWLIMLSLLGLAAVIRTRCKVA